MGMNDNRYQDPKIYRHSIVPITYDDETQEEIESLSELCEWEMTSAPLHPSVKIGAHIALGRCGNKALPGMIYCYIHSDREAMAMQIRRYYEESKNQRKENGGGKSKKSNKRRRTPGI
jgi:hypothetical protein